MSAARGGFLQRARGIDHRAVLEPDHLRARRGADQADVMGRDDHRGAEPVERGEQMQQALRHFGIDIAGRLVGDEQFGPADHRAGDRDALLLAARQRRRTGAGAVGEPDPGQHLAHRAFDLLSLAPETRSGSATLSNADRCRISRKSWNTTPMRRRKRRQRVARRIGQLLAEQADAAARRALGEVQQLEQRGLARARRAGEEIEAARRQPEVEVAQHFGARAVAQADAVEFGNCRQLLSSRRLAARGALCLAKPDAFLFTLPAPSRKRAFA